MIINLGQHRVLLEFIGTGCFPSLHKRAWLQSSHTATASRVAATAASPATTTLKCQTGLDFCVCRHPCAPCHGSSIRDGDASGAGSSLGHDCRLTR